MNNPLVILLYFIFLYSFWHVGLVWASQMCPTSKLVKNNVATKSLKHPHYLLLKIIFWVHSDDHTNFCNKTKNNWKVRNFNNSLKLSQNKKQVFWKSLDLDKFFIKLECKECLKFLKSWVSTIYKVSQQTLIQA